MELIKHDKYGGIEIGGTKLQLVVGDHNSKITNRVRYQIEPKQGAERIRQQILEGTKKLLINNEIKAIGIGFGGPVDWRSGAIELSHQVEGWGKFNLKTWLQDVTGLPVAIDNDGNTAALAEAKVGCGKSFSTVFYMTIGSGIGGGLVTNQKIYHGRKPGEVEIGHIRLGKNGTTLENECSGWAVNKKVQEQIIANPTGLLAQFAKNENLPGAYYLISALEAKDAIAIQILEEVADNIAFALSHVVHLFNPDLIVIGGGLSLLQENLRRPVADKLSHYIMHALQPAPPIRIALLGEDVVPIGAIELAKEAFL